VFEEVLLLKVVMEYVIVLQSTIIVGSAKVGI
jgi:hypothetical protein